jgi:hypothetical protein
MGFLFFLPDGENSPYRAEITINKNLMPKERYERVIIKTQILKNNRDCPHYHHYHFLSI